MDQNKNTIKKIINWNGLSVVLTGKKLRVRSNRKTKEHNQAVTSLLEHVEKWASENKINL